MQEEVEVEEGKRVNIELIGGAECGTVYQNMPFEKRIRGRIHGDVYEFTGRVMGQNYKYQFVRPETV